ncbi:MAG: hypothetical protein D6812_16925 [Deltaproteobacteria bacterium]|nr:MAG: hypothetical protein D6812_16925 [Deltaproteobacteria bacterium]
MNTFLGASLDISSSPLVESASMRTGCFYYGWYGTPDGPSGAWAHWDPTHPTYNVAWKPAQGYYDSLNPSIAKTHLTQLIDHEFDFLVHSWWGSTDQTEKVLDLHLTLLKGALPSPTAPSPIQVAALIEQVSSEPDFVDAIVHLATKARAYPSIWLQLDGRPALFVWAKVLDVLSPSECKRAIDKARATVPFYIFVDNPNGRAPDYFSTGAWDGVHDYGGAKGVEPNELQWVIDNWNVAKSAITASGRTSPKPAFAPAISPGWQFVPPTPGGSTLLDRPRLDGEHLLAYFREAILTGPDLLLWTSYNEFHEGTNIEPDLVNGDRYLRFAKQLNRLLHAI